MQIFADLQIDITLYDRKDYEKGGNVWLNRNQARVQHSAVIFFLC